MDPSIIVTTIVVQVVTFGILALVLHRFMYSAYKGELTRLQDLSIEYKNRAEQLAEDMRQTEDAHRERVDQAEAEIRELRNSIQEEAGKQREDVLKHARAESDRIIAAAMGVKDKIRHDLEATVTEKSVVNACKLIEGVMTGNNMTWFHEGLVMDVVAAVERLDEKRFQGVKDETYVLVTTPYELSKENEERLARVLRDKLAHEVSIKPFVDEAFIAGISVKIGSLVIDGSLASQLRQTAAKLQAN